MIIFAPEKKLSGAKLKKDMDDYYGYIPENTKTIKSEPLIDLDLKDVDDGTKQYDVSTNIFKVFNDIEYEKTLTCYDHRKKLYHILYENGMRKISTTMK